MTYPHIICKGDIYKVTGSEFRTWRRSQEITQQEVADFVECSNSAISRWEKGEFDFVPLMYEKILKFYNNHLVVSMDKSVQKPLNSGQRKPL